MIIITARRIDMLDLNLTMNKVSTNCGLIDVKYTDIKFLY